MKTINYLLIFVFALGLIAGVFSNRANAQTRILIQSTDSKISTAALSESATIFTARLKEFSAEKFELTVIPGKNQIQVVLADGWDKHSAEELLTRQGSLSFYATFDRESFSGLLNGDNRLFSLLPKGEPDQSPATIGCTSLTEVERIDNYLKTVSFSQKCKYAWGQPSEEASVCLYALRLEGEKGALLTGADIKTATTNQDKASGSYELGIEFKETAVKLWADATRRNLNHAIAIVLDNTVIYAPVLRSVIEGGKCSITGDFSKNQVCYMAALCNNGELSAPFKIVE